MIATTSTALPPYDWRLVLVVVVLSCFLAVGTLVQYRRALISAGHRRLLCIGLASVNAGCGLWAADFAGPLLSWPVAAFSPSDWTAFFTWLAATAVIGAGFYIATSWTALFHLAGVLIGLAITAMHYAAFRALEASLGVDRVGLSTVAAIAVISAVCSTAAIWVSARHKDLRWFSGAVLLFLLPMGLGELFISQAVPLAVVPASGEASSPLGVASLVGAIATLLGSLSAFGNIGKDWEYERLTTALDNLHVGLLVFDGDERILLCNKPYRELYEVPSHVAHAGHGTLTSLLAYRTKNGTFREDPQQYLVNLRTALQRSSSTHREPKLADGRIVSVSTHPIAGGGWVAIHENISAQKRAEQEREALQEREQRRLLIETAISTFKKRVEAILDDVSARSVALTQLADELLSSAGKTMKSATGALNTSEGASMNADSAASATNELTHAIEEINNQLVRTNSTVEDAVARAAMAAQDGTALVEATERIGDVVHLIQDIATQTNLLALNATIEAARAGAAGRGFSIVAGEVKQLSHKTALATHEIVGQVSAVQTTTKNVVDAVNSMAGAMRGIFAYSSEVASSVERQGEATHAISANVAGAAQISKVATQVLREVLQDSHVSTTSAGQVRTAAHDVERSTEKLRTEINSFLAKVSNEGLPLAVAS